MKVFEVIGDDARVTTRSCPNWKPDISVVTPTYKRNGEGLLQKCLQSALGQSFANFEHIIIDDGSNDGTEKVLLDLCERDDRIVYVRHDRNSGLPAVRTNEGIIRARGKAVAFLFDDNVLEPDFLTEAWKLLHQDGADVVHGNVDIPSKDGKVFDLGGFPLTLDLLRSLNTVANGGVLIRRDFFDRFGLYDPHLAARRVCDWELWIRALWLGARFAHLPRKVATEGGSVSPNSLENTVVPEWNNIYGYVHDTPLYEERSRHFRPSAILDQDVLDPTRMQKYVRNAAEWRTVVDAIYRPFLDQHKIDFDPLLLSNRAASVDPAQGWNPDWALQQRRIRVLVMANAVASIPAVVLEAVRAIPGAIVMNCPEWHFSGMKPGYYDVIFTVDGSSYSWIADLLSEHRRTGTRVVYLSCYGERSGPAPFEQLDYANEPSIISTFGQHMPYFPQPGYGLSAEQRGGALAMREWADLVVTVAPTREGEVGFPQLPPPPLAGPRLAEHKIAYRVSHDPPADAAEHIARTGRPKTGRASAESLASLVISRPGAEILVESSDLAALSLIDRVGLGCLAASRGVSITTLNESSPRTNDALARSMLTKQWQGWFANLVRLMRLQKRLGSRPRTRLTVDVYVDEQLHDRPETYGMRLAKGLADLGVRVRIRMPDGPAFDSSRIDIDDWSARQTLPLATSAPLTVGADWIGLNPQERASRRASLETFIAQDAPDLIIAFSHMPHLASLERRPPLFMAVSGLAFDQSELIQLRGRVDGLMSDTAWALAPLASVVGGPHRVIRCPVLGLGGAAVGHLEKRSRDATVRIAVVGTIQPNKRQVEAIRAVALLCRQGYEVELNIYDLVSIVTHDYVKRVEAAIQSEGMENIVRLHNFAEASDVTRDNDLVLCASTDESLPQSLLLQMYEGLVGVAVSCGGIDEIIVDGSTGYLTSDPHPRSVASAIARAIDDRNRWRDIAEEARRTIFAACDASHTTACLLDLIEEGLAHRVQVQGRASTAVDALAAQFFRNGVIHRRRGGRVFHALRSAIVPRAEVAPRLDGTFSSLLEASLIVNGVWPTHRLILSRCISPEERFTYPVTVGDIYVDGVEIAILSSKPPAKKTALLWLELYDPNARTTLAAGAVVADHSELLRPVRVSFSTIVIKGTQTIHVRIAGSSAATEAGLHLYEWRRQRLFPRPSWGDPRFFGRLIGGTLS